MPDTSAFDHLLLPIQDTPYDFQAIFGNAHSVELEVGFGKGRFLQTSALAHPDRNYVGIEWASKYYRLAASRAAKRGVTNVRYLRDDAAHTFKLALGAGSLAAVHVYFPDPWPKKKQQRRRIIQQPFLTEVCRVVRPGGRLLLATDHAEYFTWMVRECEAHPMVRVLEKLVGDEARHGITNYEVKYREEGRTIHNMSCEILGPLHGSA